ncbi:MAG: GNAT family N-acetyltransferase [Flavobacterium sp.]|jgi:putative acetyltransferase
MNYTIRKIESKDNAAMAKIIRTVFHELDAPKEGTAYADPILDTLSKVYVRPNEIYFVVEVDGEVLGGSGIAPLLDEDSSFCELQKMYFAPALRGKGIAQILIQQCLTFAQEVGFKACYLETLPFMKAAQKLYLKAGFQYISSPLGSTGHGSCDVFMLKKLV